MSTEKKRKSLFHGSIYSSEDLRWVHKYWENLIIFRVATERHRLLIAKDFKRSPNPGLTDGCNVWPLIDAQEVLGTAKLSEHRLYNRVVLPAQFHTHPQRPAATNG